MRHEWVFDVLRDLKAYAQSNGLPALAAKAEEALTIARAEIIALPESESDADPGHGIPPIGGHRH
ncbi:MAG: hypothetical protein RL472_318 [Pseudomonadota bacterium]